VQSWEWGEFQERLKNKIIRLGVEEKEQLLCAATLTKKTLPMGKSYFYCPRGPIIISDLRFKILDLLFKEVGKIAKKENAIFSRFEPRNELQITNYKLQITKTIDVQPAKTLILDLTKNENKLLAEMRQKTRYNIRLAEKKGVKIIEADGASSDFEEFWRLMAETKERDEFRLHNKEYYRKMLEVDFIKLFLAEYKGEIIAGNIISFFGDTVTYIHGASGNKFRNVMAPYLLQWRAIKKAKKSGYKNYDFYGIDENKWPGVTRFKKGFSGEEIKYPGTYDLVFNKGLYGIYNILRNLRRRMVRRR